LSSPTGVCHESVRLHFPVFNCSCLLGFFFSILGIIATPFSLFAWTFLVLGSVSTCGWLRPKICSSSLVQYFIVSVLGRLIFLVGTFDSPLSATAQQLALLLKLGYAPFQFWIYNVLSSLDVGSLCLFLGPFKFGILFLISSVSSPSLVLCVASFVVGLFLLWSSSSLFLVLYASGACNFLVLILLGPHFILLYYTIYCLALFGIRAARSSIISFFFAFLCLGALPPLTMFSAKFIALILLPNFYKFLVLLVSVSSLFPYLRLAISSHSPSSSSLSFCCLLVFPPVALVSFFA